jgi:hypothetical protein
MVDRVRHVWVRAEYSPTECPGLVLVWRQNPDWDALVTYVEPHGRSFTEGTTADRMRPLVPPENPPRGQQLTVSVRDVAPATTLPA